MSSGINLLPSPSNVYSLKIFFTILSSKELKVITTTLPWQLSNSSALLNPFFKTVSSSLTSILIAWNTCLAGCPLFKSAFFGKDSLIISTNSNVVWIGLISLLFMIFLAIW